MARLVVDESAMEVPTLCRVLQELPILLTLFLVFINDLLLVVVALKASTLPKLCKQFDFVDYVLPTSWMHPSLFETCIVTS